MSRARLASGTALGLALLLALTGCSGSNEDELISQAKADFGALVDKAAAADLEVLHTLEVEDPVSEECSVEHPDAEHTVFVAAGTMAVQSTLEDAAQLLFSLEPPAGPSDEEERWTAMEGLANDERGYRDENGITAAVSARDGLLLITVFSPCR